MARIMAGGSCNYDQEIWRQRDMKRAGCYSLDEPLMLSFVQSTIVLAYHGNLTAIWQLQLGNSNF